MPVAKSACLAFVSLAIFFLTGFSGAAYGADRSVPEESWSVMPEGAKPAYMGIHGGTMPVSLLVSGDGSALFSFVGRTGNDFVETLRKAHLPLPSFGNSTNFAPLRSGSQPGIFAGNATASMPVLYIGSGVPGDTTGTGQLAPFGLSSEPLSIEGPVTRPDNFPHARAIRTFSLPDYFGYRGSQP